MMVSSRLVSLACVIAIHGCSGNAPEGPGPGFETGPCIDGNCLGGLVCLSDICVLPDGETTMIDVTDSDSGSAGSSSGSTATTQTTTLDTSGSTVMPETSAADSSSGAPSESSSDGGSSSSSGGIECGGAGVAPGDACDPFAQDCQNCFKCNPWVDGGSSWNADKCVEIDDDPRDIGESCTAPGGGSSGLDDCVLGAMCFAVDQDTNMGTCVELCSGTEDSPICTTMETTCFVLNSGALPLCLPPCDPLDQSCPAGQGCYPAGSNFLCAPDASGANGNYVDACTSINGCDPGFACIAATALPGCASMVGCCTPYCDTEAANSCPGGLPCSPWYMGTPPAGLENLGACFEPT